MALPINTVEVKKQRVRTGNEVTGSLKGYGGNEKGKFKQPGHFVPGSDLIAIVIRLIYGQRHFYCQLHF
jgi:hypothetical protein